MKNIKIKSKKNLLIILTIFVIVISVISFSNKQENKPFKDKVTEHSYLELVNIWNDRVRAFELDDSNLLMQNDNRQSIKLLSEYVDFHSMPLTSEIKRSLTEVSEQYPNSLWHYYNVFLIEQRVNKELKHLELNLSYSNNELYDKIRLATGISDLDRSIELILASNNPCSYFKIYKYELWERGLSTNFVLCNTDIVDKNQHPELVRLIR